MALKKKSKMNIDLFEDINGKIILDDKQINQEIRNFYTDKFLDNGTKQYYVNRT